MTSWLDDENALLIATHDVPYALLPSRHFRLVQRAEFHVLWRPSIDGGLAGELKENAARFLDIQCQYIELACCVHFGCGQAKTEERGPIAYCRTLVANDDGRQGRNAYSGALPRNYADSMGFFAQVKLCGREEVLSVISRTLSIHRYAYALHDLWKDRSFFTTKGGRIGLGPNGYKKRRQGLHFL
jgi:hypothetical protein